MESSNRMPSHHQGPVTSGSPRTRKQSWRNVFGISTAPVLLLAVILGLMALTLATPEPAFAQSQGTGDPLTLYDANDNGVIDADELITAASDYFAGRIERDLLVRVARLYLSSAQSRTTRSTEAPMHICSLSDTNENGMIERNEVIAAINKYLFGDSMAEGALTRDDVIDVINCYLFPPEVAQASYSFSIAEDASAGTIVGTVGATGTVGRVTYSIAEGNESGQFATTTRGAITIARPLDHETRPSHTLTVRVGDGTGMWDETTVYVPVTDVDEAPKFDLDTYQFAIPVESSLATDAGDRLVGAIRAYDHDTEDRVDYSITSGNTNSYFSIDGLGRIWAKWAGRISAGEYLLTVTATDSAGLRDTATVTVKVTSQPIAKLVVDYDHFTTGRPIGVSIEFENGSGIATSNFTLTITRPTTQAGGAQGSSGTRSTTPSTRYTFGSTQADARTITDGRSYDFSIANYRSSTSIPIPPTAIPSRLSTGKSYLTLTHRTPSSTEFAISNTKIPILVEPSSLAMGESYRGEWGFLPSITSTSEPNERQFSFNVPAATTTRIDLTSGVRDSVLVLEDSSGNVLEWNDDGGADFDARIVRDLNAGNYTAVAFTRWHGGRGLFEVSVTTSKQEVTDPDGEYGDLEEAPFYVQRGAAAELIPNRRTVTAISWVTFNTTNDHRKLWHGHDIIGNTGKHRLP